MKAGAGNNTYVFGRGYGVDTIVENSNTGTDTLSFKADINPADITFWRKPNSFQETDNLYIAIKNTHDQIIIEDQFRSAAYGVDRFTFADGTIWTRENIQTWLLQSTTGDDYLVGYQSNDTLDGGAGNDLLNGGAGALVEATQLILLLKTTTLVLISLVSKRILVNQILFSGEKRIVIQKKIIFI